MLTKYQTVIHMHKFILLSAIVLISLSPMAVFAQAAPQPDPYTDYKYRNLISVLAITSGAVAGISVITIFLNMLDTELIALLGGGGLVITGAAAGAWAGYKFLGYKFQ